MAELNENGIQELFRLVENIADSLTRIAISLHSMTEEEIEE
jgi:hypothetical protein